MNRRNFVSLAAASALPLLAGCTAQNTTRGIARNYFAPDTSFVGGACGLPRVQVSADREIRTVAGLRPYRPSGFVVRAEKIGETMVVHNYGHGGSGITLSWGTSKLAVDLGAPGHRGAVAVIGAGAVGLSNAILLQEAGFDVTIYTKALPPETTSNIAGGQWFPAFLIDPEKRTPAFDTQLIAAATYAYRRYQIMVGARYGVRWMRNYSCSHHPFNEDGLLGDASPIRDFLPERRDLRHGEHPFAGFDYVRQFDTPIVEPPVYLAAMLDEFQIAGGKVRVGEIPDIAAIRNLSEKLVFNCTGLGARQLFGDEELIPVKGQLTILLPQPEIQYATLAGDLYMFPRSDGIVLGGTHVENDWSLEPDLAKKQEVVAGHQAFFQSFARC